MTVEHQPGVDNPDFYDTLASVRCEVCGKQNLLDASYRRNGPGRFETHYFCQGAHTRQEIDAAIAAAKERDA